MKIAPTVVIIGRPNVGKSTLLNSLARRRCSIVDKIPGTTRDRVSAFIKIDNKLYEFVDTGGIVDVKEDELMKEIRRQIDIALNIADVVVWVVDGRERMLPYDRSIAGMLHKLGKPVILAVNKLDKPHFDNAVTGFFSYGFKDVLGISALGKRNLDTLRQLVTEKVKNVKPHIEDIDTFLKIAIIGKRNVGKSTFVNTLIQEERMIVSEIPGTTRDAVDILFNFKGKNFLIIDTAGLRKKGKLENAVEFFSRMRVDQTINRADVVLFMIDSTEKISKVDKYIGHWIKESYKPVIMVVSKWDIAEGKVEPEDYRKYFDKVLPGLSFAPIVFVSSFKKLNLQETIELSVELFEQTKKRIPTSELNRVVKKIYEKHAPAAVGTRMPKIYYATQTSIRPPTLSIFVNYKQLFSDDYLRYFESELRAESCFSDVPIKIRLQERKRNY